MVNVYAVFVSNYLGPDIAITQIKDYKCALRIEQAQVLLYVFHASIACTILP